MSNIIKYSGGTSLNSIKSGNFNAGVNSTPTDLTEFYNGISPIIGGYTIYVKKTENGPSIHCPKNVQELIDIVKAMKGNAPIVENALVWINSQSNMVVLNSDYSSIVLNNTTTATYSAAKAGVLPITLVKGYAGSFLERLGLSIQYNVALNQSQITTIYNSTRYRYGL